MDFKLNEDNDLDFTDQKLSFVIDEFMIRQHLGIRLKFFYNEWFLDPLMGVPYREQILIKPMNMANVKAILKSTILDTPGILAPLQKFYCDYNEFNRILSVSFIANTNIGEIKYNTEIFGV